MMMKKMKLLEILARKNQLFNIYQYLINPISF